ncbi:MAG TPA: hypothetical protein VME47_12805 [Acetobacteraceae bacterium]|nr:hypothetical protein [Acetobacteraceae bacterium]
MAKGSPSSQRGPFRKRPAGRPNLNTLGPPAGLETDIAQGRQDDTLWKNLLSDLAKRYGRCERTLWRWLAAIRRDRERAQQITTKYPEIATRFDAASASMERWMQEQAQQDRDNRE